MLFNYLLLALRNISKQRGHAVVNTLGLAIGLAAAIFILLYVRDELTFDGMHPHADKTYRMGYYAKFNNETQSFPATPAGWDNYIKENYEGVTAITSYQWWGMPTSFYYAKDDKTILSEDIIWAEPNVYEVIAVNLLMGTYPKEINSMVISESAAQKIFGDEDPVNKTISVSHIATENKKVEMLISGVFHDFPANSHIRPHYIANIYALKPFIPELENTLNTYMGDGDNGFWSQSYFVCESESLIPTIQQDLQKKANEIIERLKLDIEFKPLIRKLTDVHWDNEIDWAVRHKAGDKNYIFIFITIAILILIVACINYINLSTAKSAGRAREIGLRKTFGGIRTQLFFQFMLESFLLVLISVVVACLLVIILLPQFNNVSGKVFEIAHLFAPGMLLILGGVIVFVTLIAGSYPAFFISGFKPAEVLKGKFAFRKGSNLFRQSLITLQFTVAVILLIGTIVLVNQMNLMRNSKLNEAGKQIISIRYGGFDNGASDMQYNTFKNMLLADPKISSVTLANHLPRLDYFGPIDMEFRLPEIQEEPLNWSQLNGDFDFTKTFNLKIIAGRDFDSANLADSTAIILNEAAIKSLGIAAEEIIGKAVVRRTDSNYGNQDTLDHRVTGKIIGVVEDFPYKSMHHKIDPLGISPRPHLIDRIIHVRMNGSDVGEKIPLLESTWRKLFPEYGFDYWFVDDEFARMYENEVKVSGLTEKFSLLAILITCIGLYGLASYMAQQRTREIGIRKVMGSSSLQIVLLFMKVFGKLLLIAAIIALPITYILSSKWLERFVYQTPLSVWVFAAALLTIVGITLLTVGYETARAASANPAKSLRHE